MKFFGLVFPEWLFVVGFILTLLYWFMTWNYGCLESRNIPCPAPILVFGNLLTERHKVIREEDIRKAKHYGRVYGFYEGRRPTIRIAEPDMLREIFSKQFDHFTDRRKINLGNGDPVVKKFLTLVNGAEWKQIRNVMTPTFTSSKLKKMGPLIEESIDDLIKILQEKADSKCSVDLKSQFGPLMMDIIASCAFGMRINSQNNPNSPFVQYVKQLQEKRNVFKMFMLLMIPAFLRNFFNLTSFFNQQTMSFFKQAISKVISTRKEQKIVRNDFLQLMMEAQIAEDKADLSNLKSDSKKVLTADGVVAQSIVFLVAGFETISTAMAIVCYQLAINQDCQRKLSDEVEKTFSENEGKINYEILQNMQYLDMVLMESLRWFPPSFRTERECVKSTVVGDLSIAKGTLISIPIHAIHWDEKYFPNPEKFDPERFSPENKNAINQYAFLPFGSGPRNCIGMRFALMEAKYILAHVVHQFKLLRCPETKVPLQPVPNITTIVATSGAWVRFEKR